MPRVAFKQCDLERVLRAAQAVGYSHPSVDILPGGTIRLLTQAAAVTPVGRSPWDDFEHADDD